MENECRCGHCEEREEKGDIELKDREMIERFLKQNGKTRTKPNPDAETISEGLGITQAREERITKEVLLMVLLARSVSQTLTLCEKRYPDRLEAVYAGYIACKAIGMIH